MSVGSLIKAPVRWPHSTPGLWRKLLFDTNSTVRCAASLIRGTDLMYVDLPLDQGRKCLTAIRMVGGGVSTVRDVNALRERLTEPTGIGDLNQVPELVLWAMLLGNIAQASLGIYSVVGRRSLFAKHDISTIGRASVMLSVAGLSEDVCRAANELLRRQYVQQETGDYFVKLRASIASYPRNG